MDSKRPFILLIIWYCLIGLSVSIHRIPSNGRYDESIQRLSPNYWLRNAEIHVKQVINETQPLIENLSSIFNSLYENYEKDMTNKSLFYLDKIDKFKTNSNENCYTYGYQVMYSAYLKAIDNVTDCFKQELQEFKENNIPTDREFKIIMEKINYECHNLFYFVCKQPTFAEIEKLIIELENHKKELLKKNFTDEINHTELLIDKCTQFSIKKLDELLDDGVSQAIKCDTESYF